MFLNEVEPAAVCQQVSFLLHSGASASLSPPLFLLPPPPPPPPAPAAHSAVSPSSGTCGIFPDAWPNTPHLRAVVAASVTRASKSGSSSSSSPVRRLGLNTAIALRLPSSPRGFSLPFHAPPSPVGRPWRRRALSSPDRPWTSSHPHGSSEGCANSWITQRGRHGHVTSHDVDGGGLSTRLTCVKQLCWTVGWRAGRMTAGTVVITGGILATVILLCIIAVLCYCRLQYYCCRKNGSDSASVSQQRLACNACSVPGLDGSVVTPLSWSPPEPPRSSERSKHAGGQRGYCPTCSPHDSPFYIRAVDEMHNGGERITYMPTHYENQALAMPLPAVHGTLLREAKRGRPSDFYTNTRAISTEV